VGCGTGQATAQLAPHFDKLIGVDASQKQLDSAIRLDNIEYRLGTAENTGVEEHVADLVTVAQTAHWLKMESFYVEAKRILKPHGTLAIWGYTLCSIPTSTEVTALVKEYHTDTLGKYWEAGRDLLDAGYTHIDPPFAHTERVWLSMRKTMSVENFVNYLGTFSALKNYRDKHPENPDPLVVIGEKVNQLLKENVEVEWPIILIKLHQKELVLMNHQQQLKSDHNGNHIGMKIINVITGQMEMNLFGKLPKVVLNHHHLHLTHLRLLNNNTQLMNMLYQWHMLILIVIFVLNLI